MALKRIQINQLRVGMYMTGCDLPWIATPFWRRRFLIRKPSEIDKLKRCGVLEVEIDTARGLDVEPFRSHGVADQPSVPPSPAQSCLPLAQDLAQARKVRKELLTSVQSVFDAVSAGIVPAEQVKHVAHRILSATLAQPSAFLALTRTRQFDPSLQEHALSVCTFALFLGQKLEYGEARLEHVANAALLHDVGLLRLPHYMVRLAHRLSKHNVRCTMRILSSGLTC